MLRFTIRRHYYGRWQWIVYWQPSDGSATATLRSGIADSAEQAERRADWSIFAIKELYERACDCDADDAAVLHQ